MKKTPGWTVNVETLSHQGIVDLLRELHGSVHRDVISSLQRELIRRLRMHGMTDSQIIRRLAYAVPRGRKLTEVAKEWAAALDISVEEFKRVADAK